MVQGIGGSREGRAPPTGPDSFVLTCKIFRNVAASGVHGPPLWEILDPPLQGVGRLGYEGVSLCA